MEGTFNERILHAPCYPMRIYRKKTTSSSSHYPSDLAWKGERLPHNHSSESPLSLPILPFFLSPFNATNPLSPTDYTQNPPGEVPTIQSNNQLAVCSPPEEKRVEKHLIEKMVPMLSLARVPNPMYIHEATNLSFYTG